MATVQPIVEDSGSFVQREYSPAAKRALARKPALFINNEWVASTHGATLIVEDPSTGREVGRIVDASDADVDRAVAAARAAFDDGRWSNLPPKVRERTINKLANLLEANLAELAELEAIDNGKPVGFAKLVDIPGSIDHLRYMAGWASKLGGDVLDPNDPEKEQTIRWQSEMLFYRYSEIRRRAVLVNTKLHPDLVLCLHFNAEGWGDPSKPTLIDNNHLHLLVNGSYLQEELDLDDERFEMIRRLLSRAYDEELPIADTVATSMAKATGLPPFQYPTTLTTTKVGSSGYVYARNLLATRLYRCPVVYCEPYVMNSKDGFARIQAGDYQGTKEINGVDRKSIFREYADSVAEGLSEYYSRNRGL